MSNPPVECILVVDDDAVSRMLLEGMLKEAGYHVDTVSGGREALEWVVKHPVDLVLLDVFMPGIGGIEVLDRLRIKHDALSLPIIMATAADQPEREVHALERGANDYVAKPIEKEVLLARIRTHMGLKRVSEQLEIANRRMKEELQSAEEVRVALTKRLLALRVGSHGLARNMSSREIEDT